MSSVIKSSAFAELSLVKPLQESPAPAATPAPRSPEAEEADRLGARVTQLERSIREMETAATGLRADIDKSYQRGRDEGYVNGLEDAGDKQDERLELLAQGVKQAMNELQAGIEAMERTAIVLARECLDVMFGDAGDRAVLVEGLIRRQLEQIDRGSLLRIEVSPVDFPDETALSALSANAGLDGGMIVAKSRMPAGGCTMLLRLGQMDLGIDQQWRALRRTLGEMAGEGSKS